MNFNPLGAHNDGLAIATAQTIAKPAGSPTHTTVILIQTIGQNARYTLDGSAPTATKGFQIVAGDPPVVIPLGPSATFRIIEEAATADLQYQFGT